MKILAVRGSLGKAADLMRPGMRGFSSASGDAKILYSEDLQDGQMIDDLCIQNPFGEAAKQ